MPAIHTPPPSTPCAPFPSPREPDDRGTKLASPRQAWLTGEPASSPDRLPWDVQLPFCSARLSRLFLAPATSTTGRRPHAPSAVRLPPFPNTPCSPTHTHSRTPLSDQLPTFASATSADPSSLSPPVLASPLLQKPKDSRLCFPWSSIPSFRANTRTHAHRVKRLLLLLFRQLKRAARIYPHRAPALATLKHSLAQTSQQPLPKTLATAYSRCQPGATATMVATSQTSQTSIPTPDILHQDMASPSRRLLAAAALSTSKRGHLRDMR